MNPISHPATYFCRSCLKTRGGEPAGTTSTGRPVCPLCLRKIRRTPKQVSAQYAANRKFRERYPFRGEV